MPDLAYISGLDRIPWKAGVRYEDGRLEVQRSASEAGCLHVPWQVEGYGLLTLATATLIERPEPYCLPVELARGKLGQVRSQLADWRAMGLRVPEGVVSTIAEAIGWFSEAAIGDHGSSRSVELAGRALRAALDAGHQLAASYAEQWLALRRSSGRLDVRLGVDLGLSLPNDQTTAACREAFNAGRVPMVWSELEPSRGDFHWEIVDRQIEWCRTQGLAICAGPLVQLDSRVVPDWLPLSRGNIDQLFLAVLNFVEAAVVRYRRAIDVWIAVGRVNTGDAFPITEEENIRLTALVVQAIRPLDARAELIISFDQPWTEYLRHRESDFPPLHLADALVRADLGLTGVGLDLNIDYVPGGTLPRDPLEFSRQIDYWSLLGVPLYLVLTVPSGSHFDPLAQRLAGTLSGTWTPASQRDWVGRYVPLLLAKPSVRGLFWGQLCDFEPHAFRHGGLLDLRRQPKPALAELASIRRQHLG
jgi:hypothetical protein